MHPRLRPLILASASPRRRQLLASLGEEFEVLVPDVDESLTGDPAVAEVERLARRKAQAIVGLRSRGTVIAADTVVELDGAILGKPTDDRHAREMLRSLSGSEHRVHTGVAVLHLRRGVLRSGVETTRIVMRTISDAEIEAYVRSGEPMDKAGAYAVQETGDRFLTTMEGAYDNVVGLPMEKVATLLEDLAEAVGVVGPGG